MQGLVRELLLVSLEYFTAMGNKLLVILGPTSTGKTDLAIYLALKFNGELISADSRQVYKGLDIGTGKEASIKYQVVRGEGYWIIDGIKIWMYDVADPGQRYNLYQYIIDAQKVIGKIVEKGKLPILVGGTGLYIRGLIEGISDFGSEADLSLRGELETLEIEQIQERIASENPDIFKALNNSELNNKRRLIRILEKVSAEKSGKSFPGIGEDFDVLKIGLKTDRSILDKRIKERVIKRINEGMIEESEKLLKEKILNYERMDELGLEYRYIAKYLKGEIKTKDELIEILSLRIRQFAKRQMTWFRKEKDVSWFDILERGFLTKVDYQVLNWYNLGKGVKSITSTTSTTGS